MDIKELKTKVKVLLGQNLSAEELEQLKQIIVRQEQVVLAEAKTQDGKVLSYEGELAAGTAVNLVTEAGSEPAPDGEYLLEDGKTTVYVAAGVITNVENNSVGEQPDNTGMPEMVQQMETKFNSQVKTIEDAYSAKFAAQKEEIGKLSSEVKFLSATLQKLIESPVEIVTMSKQTKTWDEMTPKERYEFMYPVE